MKTKVLLYCTKAKPYLSLYRGCCRNEYVLDNEKRGISFNGTIVAECEVECEEIKYQEYEDSDYGAIWYYFNENIHPDDLVEQSCLDYEELENYGTKHIVDTNGEEYDYFADLYAYQIVNLKPFVNPLELQEVMVKKERVLYDRNYDETIYEPFECPLEHAPRNICWVWYKGEKYLWLPCSPKECANILNKIQTILVRKKILRGM